MKKICKITSYCLIVIISLILIDGFCARFLKTKPLIATKEITISGVTESGVVYKSLFANIYYCDTIFINYDGNKNRTRSEKVIRYYQKKDANFSCPIVIDEKANIFTGYEKEIKDNNLKDFDYMKKYVEGLYQAKFDSMYSYNAKLNMLIHNFIGSSLNVSNDHQKIYMFDVADFSKDPILLEIEGFDMTWRGTNIKSSPSGEVLAFYYICGTRGEQWMGPQKYSKADCEKNKSENGIYVFKVNAINSYEQLAFYPETNNNYLQEYKQSYFRIMEIIDDENIKIKYTITNDVNIKPIKEVYYIWDFVNNTSKEMIGGEQL